MCSRCFWSTVRVFNVLVFHRMWISIPKQLFTLPWLTIVHIVFHFKYSIYQRQRHYLRSFRCCYHATNGNFSSVLSRNAAALWLFIFRFYLMPSHYRCHALCFHNNSRFAAQPFRFGFWVKRQQPRDKMRSTHTHKMHHNSSGERVSDIAWFLISPFICVIRHCFTI